MTSNSPQGKSFNLRNCWGINIFPIKKGSYYSNLPPSPSSCKGGVSYVDLIHARQLSQYIFPSLSCCTLYSGAGRPHRVPPTSSLLSVEADQFQ